MALEGFQEEGVVRFDDAAFPRVAMLGDQGQKAMPPSKGRVLVDGTAASGRSDRQSLDQRLGIVLPTIGLTQACQRRGRQGIARSTTRATPIPTQPATPAPGG